MKRRRKPRWSLATIVKRTLRKSGLALARNVMANNALYRRIDMQYRDRENARSPAWMAAYERHWELEGPHA